ncbi:DUF4345 domain-containing protein [Granulosicoccus sp. 3-233]|uniref:DUF4345 domain-containing protein n=1 Tax=Granulosicoccus sp. 3-233 TaxID=3417969 RepID=UPI003D356068
MNSRFAKTRIVMLLLSGSLLVLVGASILVSPVAFFAHNRIELGANISLLNELKAPAGLLLVAGLFMIATVFRRSQADVALRLAALIYLSYALTRGLSLMIDGMPASGLVQAMALEGAIGLSCMLLVMFDRTLPEKVL